MGNVNGAEGYWYTPLGSREAPTTVDGSIWADSANVGPDAVRQVCVAPPIGGPSVQYKRSRPPTMSVAGSHCMVTGSPTTIGRPSGAVRDRLRVAVGAATSKAYVPLRSTMRKVTEAASGGGSGGEEGSEWSAPWKLT